MPVTEDKIYTTEFQHKYQVGDEVQIYPFKDNNKYFDVRVAAVRYRGNPMCHIVTYDLEFVDKALQDKWGGYTDYPEHRINNPN